MHNLRTVYLFEFTRTLKKPSFWISVLATPVVIAVIFALNFFSSTAAKEASKAQESKPFSLQVVDESGFISDKQLQAINASRAKNKKVAVAAVKAGTVDAVFYYPADPSAAAIEVYNKDDGLFENFRYPTIAQSLLKSGAEAKAGSSKTVALIKDDAKTNQTTYQNGHKAPGYERLIIPLAFLVILYYVIIFLGGQMLTSTTEEKENRVIEMILTTINPRTLIIGKILAILTLGFVQAGVMLLPLAIAFVFFRDHIALPQITLDLPALFAVAPWRIALATGYLVSSFLLFTGLLVAISAAVPTAKDANNFFGFVIFMMFIPFYAIAGIFTDPSQMIVQVFSYFPLTAPMTLMVRNAIGNLGPAEGLIGLVILLLSGLFAIVIATRIFRYGTLEYSRMLTLSEIFKKQTHSSKK